MHTINILQEGNSLNLDTFLSVFIEAASKLLALLPHTMEYIAMLTIMVSIADSTGEYNNGLL